MSHALAARGESLGPTAIEGIAANAHAGALSHASDSGLMNSLQQGHNWGEASSHTEPTNSKFQNFTHPAKRKLDIFQMDS